MNENNQNEMPAPTEKVRWLNDTDCDKTLIIEQAVLSSNGVDVDILFRTPMQELVRRTTKTSFPEYAFLRNNLGGKWKGAKVVYWKDTKTNYRSPISAVGGP